MIKKHEFRMIIVQEQGSLSLQSVLTVLSLALTHGNIGEAYGSD